MNRSANANRAATLAPRAIRPAHWALATLALALAGAATLVQAADSGPMAGADHPGGPRHAMMAPGGAMHGAGMPGMFNPRMLDGLGASEDQKSKLHAIMRSAHEDMRKQHQAQADVHRQLAATLAAPQLDAAAAEALRQKLEAGHDAASKRMLQAMLDASAVLTPEQRQKLSQRMGQRHEMMERHRRERQSLDAPKS